VAEDRGVAPRRDDVSTSDDVATLEGTTESMFVQHVIVVRHCDEARHFESNPIIGPRVKGRSTTPRQFVAPRRMVTAPQCAITLVKFSDVLHPVERAPRPPRRAKRQFVAQ
jgi:hypothetical protein